MPGVIHKVVSFSAENERELYDYAQTIPNFSGWVKRLLAAHRADRARVGQAPITRIPAPNSTRQS
ncbi:MAG: hypothetical protein OWS03_02820 [Alicyclobacillaceae bacterium]|nr:hypothetical protein [Alicyclobacillaceae bacterium]